jgi:branched-chain amino acid transport system substrate-binding protein
MAVGNAAVGAILGRHAVQDVRAISIAAIDHRPVSGQRVADEFDRAVKLAGGSAGDARVHERQGNRLLGFREQADIRSSRPGLLLSDGRRGWAYVETARQAGITARFLGGDGICGGALPNLSAGTMSDNQVICAEAGGIPAAEQSGMGSFKARCKRRFNADVQVCAPHTGDTVMVIASALPAAL